ncbi:MAG: ABC transporter permease [Promethearchaeia archaeon]
MKKFYKKSKRSNIKGSKIRLTALIKKDLMRFFKNPKQIGFLIGIPIVYYIFMGLMLSNVSTAAENKEYSIGWVDDDTSTANHTLYPNYNLDVCYNTLNDLDNIKLEKFDSKDTASKAQINEEIIAFVYFPQGYEKSLEEAKVGNRTAPLKYEIYFLQSVSPSTKSIIEQLINSVMSKVINYDYANPDLDVSYESKSTVGHEVDALSYQAPGMILYAPMTILSFVLVIITGEKKDGIYKRLSSSEVRNWEIITSNTFVSIILVFMQFLIGVGVLYIFGWEPIIHSMFDAILGVFLVIFLFSLFILSLGFILAPVFKDPDTAGGGVWIIIIPLMMLTGIFFPIDFFSEEMKAVANVLPPRFAVIIMNDLLLKGLPVSNSQIVMNLIYLLIYSAVLFVIGIKAFNKFKS